jgi:hypothetical protein
MQWQNAEKGNSTMLVWLGKQYLNQKDKSEVQSTVEQRHVIDLTRISDEELQSIEAAFSRIDPGASESGEVPQIIEGVHEG